MEAQPAHPVKHCELAAIVVKIANIRLAHPTLSAWKWILSEDGGQEHSVFLLDHRVVESTNFLPLRVNGPAQARGIVAPRPQYG